MASNEELQAQLKALRAELAADKIAEAFTRSKFIADRLVIPADMVRAKFANSFSVEGGAVIATDGQGGRIMSRARPGEVADFEEAIEALIGAYPHRDQIMRGGAGRGTGAHAGNGSAGKIITRSAWDKLPPLQQREVLTSGKLTLID